MEDNQRQDEFALVREYIDAQSISTFCDLHNASDLEGLSSIAMSLLIRDANVIKLRRTPELIKDDNVTFEADEDIGMGCIVGVAANGRLVVFGGHGLMVGVVARDIWKGEVVQLGKDIIKSGYVDVSQVSIRGT